MIPGTFLACRSKKDTAQNNSFICKEKFLYGILINIFALWIVLFSGIACSTACLIHPRTIDAVVLMHCPQLSAPAASVPLILLPDKFIKAVFLNERKIFQHTHVIFCAIPFVQRFQSVTGIFCAFKAKGFLVFAFLDGTVLTSFSFAAMAVAMAGQPLALVGLAQGAIHPTGRHKLLQSHFLFSINHMFFQMQKTGQPLVDRFGGKP